MGDVLYALADSVGTWRGWAILAIAIALAGLVLLLDSFLTGDK